MDVHDVGQRDWIFQPCIVLSCEPGFTLRRRNWRKDRDRCRREQSIDLMADMPLEIEEIEELMSNKSHI